MPKGWEAGKSRPQRCRGMGRRQEWVVSRHRGWKEKVQRQQRVVSRRRHRTVSRRRQPVVSRWRQRVVSRQRGEGGKDRQWQRGVRRRGGHMISG